MWNLINVFFIAGIAPSNPIITEMFGKESVTVMLEHVTTDPDPVIYSMNLFPREISVYNRNTRPQVELLYNTMYNMYITAILCGQVYWSRFVQLHYSGKSLLIH